MPASYKQSCQGLYLNELNLSIYLNWIYKMALGTQRVGGQNLWYIWLNLIWWLESVAVMSNFAGSLVMLLRELREMEMVMRKIIIEGIMAEWHQGEVLLLSPNPG